MRFKNEAEFEQHLRGLIKSSICAANTDILVLDNKNIADIVICKNGDDAGIFFIEVKHLKPSDGRLGFGSAKGAGFQPEILGQRPKYLESNLIWVLYSDKHENNNIVVLTSEQLCEQYLQGGKVGEKYNGIKQSVFSNELGYTDVDFIEYLKTWLSC